MHPASLADTPTFEIGRAAQLLMQKVHSGQDKASHNLYDMFPGDQGGDPWNPPPPIFDLPPPPRPPWLEPLDDCHELSTDQDDFDGVCQRIGIADFSDGFESTFHSVAVVVVCSIVAVIMVIACGVIIFRRRKGLLSYHHHNHHQGGHLRSPCSDTLAETDDLNHEARIHIRDQQRYLEDLRDSMKRSSAMRRSASNHSPTATGSRLRGLTLPNHYIQENKQPDRHQPRLLGTTQNVANQQRQLLSDRPPNLMELASQPPSVPGGQMVYHSYPHIIIGGQPFYLIPSDPTQDVDPYAYPPDMPIYEEIDKSVYSSAAPSDRGEAGSLVRQPHQQHLLFRFHQHSENEENDSSSTGSSRPSPPLLARSGQLPPNNNPRVLVNPMIRDTSFSEGNSYENSVMITNPGQSLPGTSCSSGSISATTAPRRVLPRRSPGTSSSSQTSSLYYYSDTLKKRAKIGNNNNRTELSDDISDSGVSSSLNNTSSTKKAPIGLGSSSSESYGPIMQDQSSFQEKNSFIL